MKKSLIALSLMSILFLGSALDAKSRACGCGGARPSAPAPAPKPVEPTAKRASVRRQAPRTTQAPRPSQPPRSSRTHGR